VVFVVIIMVVVVNLVPGLDVVLGGDAEAKQDLGRQAPGAGADKMDTAAGLTGQAAEHGIDVAARHLVGFRDHHHVGAGKLVLEQFRQGRFVVDAVIGFALGIDRGLATVMTPSTVTRVRISGQLKARTRGWGRARPEVSMTMWSGSTSRASSCFMVGTKSSATVQQIQPLESSMISTASSSAAHSASPQPRSTSASTPISPNSLMISAMRLPPFCASRLRIRVVLPAPRKPVMTVAGIFWGMGLS
jgi:hypothetical protein